MIKKNKRLYKEAAKGPVEFWEKLASRLFWFKKWKKGFQHQPPYFQWFQEGKINISTNIFEKNRLGFKKIKNKPALIWEPEPAEEEARTLTYGHLFEEVNRFANALKKLGVKKGARVGIYLPMIPEVIVAMLACARIGAVHSVVFSAFSSAALRIRLQDTEAKILITADGYFRRGKVINLKQNVDQGIKRTRVKKVIVVKRLSSCHSERSPKGGAKNPEIALWDPSASPQDDNPGKQYFWYHELIAKESDKCQPEIMDAEDLLFILYTSGSTGKPKGCVHTCGGYTVQAYWTGKWIFDLDDDSVFWCTSDPGWVTGHTYTIYSPLLNGATTLMYEGALDWPEPDRWAKIIEKHKVNIFYTAPTAIRMFEKYGADLLKRYKFTTLRLLGSVGEPIDEAAWRWYYREVGRGRCPIVDTWWQTETGGILITSLPGIGPFKPSFAGLPFPGVKVDILDNKGESVAAPKQGNLVVLPPFAPGLLRGIYKNPKKYLETYWSQYGKETYFSSDAALKDKNGLIRIVGRVDDVIKVAGHRLTTGELEAAINLHPKVVECAVVGIPDKIKGEVPVAFVVVKGEFTAKGGKPGFEADVIAQVRKEISPIASPKQVYLVKDLPKTRSGKIMRRILKRLFTGEDLGDLSTLANPENVEGIRKCISAAARDSLS